MTEKNTKQYANLQEVFDTAYIGMAKQQWQPAYFGSGCVYYDKRNGNRCAIGQCIPDDLVHKMPIDGTIEALNYTVEVYSPESELYMPRTDWVNRTIQLHEKSLPLFEELKELFKNIETHKLTKLQNCHDDVAIRGTGLNKEYTMKANFERFARVNGLTIPVIETE